MDIAAAPDVSEFAQQHGLGGLTAPTLDAIRTRRPRYSLARGRQFLRFQKRIDRELLRHRVITSNPYAAWFRRGEQNVSQLKAFVVQFSVFSNLFLLAQLHKMINAGTLEGMRASKEILANEIGVIFNPHGARASVSTAEYDPERIGTEGTVQGGTFRFEAAHFEWLLQVAQELGLGFADIGKRRFGTAATLLFCDELVRLYGNEDYAISQAASYAVENWAAAGFWGELIEGLVRYNGRHGTSVPLGFFAWHNRLEAQHARHTQAELEELYFRDDLDEDAFIRHGNEMLEAVWAFWDGLEVERRKLELPH